MEEKLLNELVKQWQQSRDQNAVEKLYSGLSPFFKYLLSRSIKTIDTESILNESFFKAVNRFDITKGVKFISFLGVVFKEDCRVYKRRFNAGKRRDFISVNQQIDNQKENAILSGFNKKGKSTKIVLNGSEREDLLEAIGRLPQREAEILRMYIDGSNQAEIRRELGLSKSSMNQWMEKAVLSLKRVYV